MDDSIALYAGGAIFAVILLVTVLKAGLLGKAKLPVLPDAGPLPIADLPKYFETSEPVLAWERVRGWALNEVPPALNAPAPIDHLILTPRVLNFCSGASGKLELSFNFLVAAIRKVDFDPNALPPGAGPPGQGLLTVYTPSGRTLVLTTGAFAQATQRAMSQASQVTTG